MNVGVLISGAGSNLQALIDTVHASGAPIVAVASDRADAAGLDRARTAGIPAQVFAKAGYPDRVARDLALADWLAAAHVELVVTAGYMALLDAAFIARFPDKIVNVHPSLLPAFPGVRAIEQAIAYGAHVIGVTVHLVDEGVDTGTILSQRAIALPAGATAEAAHALLQPIEHALLPAVVGAMAGGLVRRDPTNARRLLVG